MAKLYDIFLYDGDAAGVEECVRQHGVDCGALAEFILWADSRGSAINHAKQESRRIALWDRKSREMGVRRLDNPTPSGSNIKVYRLFDYGEMEEALNSEFGWVARVWERNGKEPKDGEFYSLPRFSERSNFVTLESLAKAALDRTSQPSISDRPSNPGPTAWEAQVQDSRSGAVQTLEIVAETAVDVLEILVDALGPIGTAFVLWKLRPIRALFKVATPADAIRVAEVIIKEPTEVDPSLDEQYRYYVDNPGVLIDLARDLDIDVPPEEEREFANMVLRWLERERMGFSQSSFTHYLVTILRIDGRIDRVPVQADSPEEAVIKLIDTNMYDPSAQVINVAASEHMFQEPEHTINNAYRVFVTIGLEDNRLRMDEVDVSASSVEEAVGRVVIIYKDKGLQYVPDDPQRPGQFAIVNIEGLGPAISRNSQPEFDSLDAAIRALFASGEQLWEQMTHQQKLFLSETVRAIEHYGRSVTLREIMLTKIRAQDMSAEELAGHIDPSEIQSAEVVLDAALRNLEREGWIVRSGDRYNLSERGRSAVYDFMQSSFTHNLDAAMHALDDTKIRRTGFLGTIADMLGGFTPAASSNVRSFKYSPGSRQLQVKFHDGGTYTYHDIPPIVADAFATSPSKGRFVWQVLRNWGKDDRYRVSRNSQHHYIEPPFHIDAPGDGWYDMEVTHIPTGRKLKLRNILVLDNEFDRWALVGISQQHPDIDIGTGGFRGVVDIRIDDIKYRGPDQPSRLAEHHTTSIEEALAWL